MAMKTAVAAVGAGALIALHGCGDSGPATTSASPSKSTPSNPTTGSAVTSASPSKSTQSNPITSSTSHPATLSTASPAPTRTSTTLAPAPTTPLSGADAADLMNAEYHAFNKDDQAGSYGTYIRVADTTEIFCHTSCYNGWADCRVSGSMYNPTQIVTGEGKLAWSFGDEPGVGTKTAFWVNQTLIKRSLGKCAYTSDGGTDYRYNMGCGNSTAAGYGGHCTTTGAVACEDHNCPYLDLDPATDYATTVTGESAVVEDAMMGSTSCSDPGRCAYKGPSFYKETGYVDDHIFDMIQWRATFTPGSSYYNEVILDGELMLQELQYNAAAAIPAILYVDGGKDAATTMAATLQSEWNMAAPVPVIKVDTEVVVTAGGNPFVFEDSDEVTV